MCSVLENVSFLHCFTLIAIFARTVPLLFNVRNSLQLRAKTKSFHICILPNLDFPAAMQVERVSPY